MALRWQRFGQLPVLITRISDEGRTGTRDVCGFESVRSLCRLGEPVITLSGLFSFGGHRHVQAV
jgi:hypothetical protein